MKFILVGGLVTGSVYAPLREVAGGLEALPKEVAMYAVFGRVEIDSSRADEAIELLNNYTVPMVKQAPGFVSGTWARSEDGTRGQSVLPFENEGAAKAAAERHRRDRRPARR